MRIKDFENAINALNCSIVLDEVKLHNGHVRRFFAHRNDCLLMWDENGHAYSSTEINADVVRYERDSVYDLDFE